MTEVAPPIDYQQTPPSNTPNTAHENAKDSKIYIHTGNIANWTNVKSRRSNNTPANELYQALYRTITKYGPQQLNNWNDEEVCRLNYKPFLFLPLPLRNQGINFY